MDVGAAGNGRLRHRLLIAEEPQPAAAGHPEDRPEFAARLDQGAEGRAVVYVIVSSAGLEHAPCAKEVDPRPAKPCRSVLSWPVRLGVSSRCNRSVRCRA